MKAIWNDEVIAESDDTLVVEGNHYFPKESVKKEFLEESEHTSQCAWKGQAQYFDLKVNNEVNENAVWYYPEPKEMAKDIKNRVAFWKGVEVTD